MPKTKISEYSTTNSANTDIEGINIDEGCPPSSINNAIRELMVHLKEFQTGASGDAFTFAGGTLMSGTNTISGAAVISGNINSSGTNTFTGTQVIETTDNTNAALRITQLGTGNALLVEDSANPDSTPFVIDAGANVIRGNTTPLTTVGFASTTTLSPGLQNHSTTISGAAVSAFVWNAAATSSPQYILSRSRGTTAGTFGVVSSGDNLGGLTFNGDDGTAFVTAASISSQVDGTPGTNDMPGRLLFNTTADGASSTTERMRITSAGNVGIATTAPAAKLNVAGNTILSNVDMLNASYDSVSFSVGGEETSPSGLFFSPDGTRMYVIGSTGDDVNQYSLSTPWVVSSATYVTNFSVSGQDTAPNGIFFRADGLKMYIVGITNDTVYQYALTTPWTISTASYESISFSVASQDTNPTGVFFKPNGLTMFVVGAIGDAVYQYGLSTAWNVSTATFTQSFSVSGQETAPQDLFFTGDGSRMFILGSTGDDVTVYNLTTPWDISTAATTGQFSVSGQDATPAGLYVKPDGTKFYMLGATNDAVYQYTIPSIEINLTGTTNINGGATVAQDLTVDGIVQVSAGSATVPGIAPSTDTNTGIFFPAADTIAFAEGGSERMRIDSSGNVGIGTSSPSTYGILGIVQAGNASAIGLRCTNASFTSEALFLSADRNTTNGTFYFIAAYNYGGTAYKFRVADSGNVTNTNGSYGTISDAKLKQDIVDANSQWDDIKNLRFRKYRLKSEVELDPNAKPFLGLVAQEAELVSPGLIEEHKDTKQEIKTREVEKTREIPAVLDDEGNEVTPAITETYTETEEYTETVDLGTTTKSIKTSILYMKAVKALQEAMTRIEALEAEVAAMKAN